MKYNLLIVTVLLIGFHSSAQEKIPFIDYDSVYEKVNENSEKGDYDKAYELLGQISKNDSTYCSVLVSKSYYLMAQEKYEEAIVQTDEGLNSTNCADLHSSFYINKAIAYLKQDKDQEAINTCDEGLKRFPQNVSLTYNRGVALEGVGRIEDAIAAYQKTILLDPFFTKSYLQLGNICYKQELMSQALMCYNMFLALEPDGSNAFNILKSLNNTVQSKNENTRNPDLEVSVDDDTFEEIDLILNNRLALNENYDAGNEIKIALNNQNHALMESLKSYTGNGGFWDTKFVPYYQWVVNSGNFNAFCYTIAYSIENETYKKIVEKKIDEIQEFYDLSKEKWAELVKNNTVEVDGKKENTTYYFEDGYVKGIGKSVNDVLQGPWELYSSNGRRTAKGSFNAQGNRDGEWQWFNLFGKVKETALYEDGKLHGKNLHYYDNGRQRIVANYENDELSGEYLFYGEKGALKQKKYFKNGKLHGEFQSYHNVGGTLLESKAEYVDGKVQSNYVEYFPHGKKAAEINFKDGKAHGQETKYYANGTLSSDWNSKEGYVDGYYKQFHANGSPKEVGQSLEGNYVGNWKSYFSHGTLASEYGYNDDGEADGEYKYYDKDGKLHYIFEYRKGELIAYKYFDKSGNVLDENRKKGGEFYYRGYTPYGKLRTEGLYDVKGGKKGQWKYYDKYGMLTDSGFYEDDKIQGAYTTYYKHGEIESVYQYKNDTIHGYYVYYHKNGKIQRQGWYKDNELHGEWRSYNSDGSLSEINFYHKGSFHGEQLLFSGKGKKTRNSIYEYGDVNKDIYYDPQGNVAYEVDRENDQSEYELVYEHYNKKPSTKISYVNGIKHGPYLALDYYGNKVTTGQYLNGKLHGELVWYHDNGQVATRANYTNGELDGDYFYYYENGQLDGKYHYVLGELQKEALNYHDNGTISTKSEYVDDERHGRRETYDPSGKLQLVRFYAFGRLLGYSYLDQNGSEIPMIPMENETGKIVAYYDNGNVSTEMEYKNGFLDKVFKEYYYSGQLLAETHYENEDYHGKRLEYYSNGNLKRERTYAFDNLNGVAKEYYENGNLKKEETYLHDTKEGMTKRYDSKGKLIAEEMYFDGNIVSSTLK
nr:hypothetical protein [Allomuricauda sp.]